MRRRLSRALRHFAAASSLAALTIIWSLPFVLHLSTHLPGAGLGDNTQFLWNCWWMRTALASGQDFFRTGYLFSPVGADLTLHSSTALSAFVGATLLGRFPVLTALNVTTLAGLALNAVCAYALAWRATRDRGAAMLAGMIFAGSPYIAAHFNGHFDLTSAWTIPLFALTAEDAMRGSTRAAVVSGLLFGVTAYMDYYYVVFEVAFAVCALALAAGEWSFAARATRPYPGWCFALVGIAIVSDLLVIAVTGLTGGRTIQLGGARLGVQDAYNPRQLLWVFVALA